MNLQSYIKNIDTKEVITCVLLIVVGYMTAQLFMRKYNGFSVGSQNSCKCDDCKDSDGKIRTYYDNCGELSSSDCQYGYSKDSGGGKFKCVVGKDNKCAMSGGRPNITGTCPDCKDPSTNNRKITRGQCQGLSKSDCSRMWGIDSNKQYKPCTWTESQNKCNNSGGRPMKCPSEPPGPSPGPPGPSPGPPPGPPSGPPSGNSKTSYNCNASKCVSVSGTSGTYSSESDCQSKCGKPPGGNSPPPPPGGKTPPPSLSFSCSSTWNNSDICFNNNKAVDYTKWSDNCTDNDDICKGCQKNCKIWYEKTGIVANFIFGIIAIFVGLIGAFKSSEWQGFFFILIVLSIISWVLSLYFYEHNQTSTPGGEN